MTSVDEGLVGGKREPATEHGLPSVVDGAGEEEQVLPVIMCSRTSPDPVPECQLFPDESEESEEGVTEECKERESDRDSAAESSQGSDSSEGLTRHLDKEDTLGELYFSGDKCAQASISITSDLSTRSSASLNEEQFEDYGEGEEPEYTPSSPSPDDETRTNGYSDLGSSVPSRFPKMNCQVGDVDACGSCSTNPPEISKDELCQAGDMDACGFCSTNPPEISKDELCQAGDMDACGFCSTNPPEISKDEPCQVGDVNSCGSCSTNPHEVCPEQSSSEVTSSEEEYVPDSVDDSDISWDDRCTAQKYGPVIVHISMFGLLNAHKFAGQTPRKVRHQYAGELMDVYCSQCSKKVNLLNDLDARLKNLRAHSPSRKISSTAFGRQLLHNSNLSSRNGSTEDLFRDSIDSCDIDINEKVSSLEKKVAELENEILMNSDLKSKLKQENTQLVHRVNELEEQLKDQETRAEQNFQEELRRHREAYSKMERDKNTQIELLTSRIKNLEEENSEMSASMFRLKSQTEKLDEEKQRMTDKLEDTSLRLKDEMDLYRKMMDKLKQNREQFQKEKDAMQELIEDLRRELEHLQLYKLEAEKPGRSRSSSSGLSDFNSRSREVELEHEVKRLKQETQKLREQNDDLNGQILSLSLHEAKNLFATQTKAQSLAAEIDSASRDQLMEALKEQEDINLCLRQYMDKVILSILDHNPSILEIKN